MTVQGENLLLTPAQVRAWLESATFRYPSTRPELTAPLKGFGHIPVFPTLWGWLRGQALRPTPDELAHRLMALADPKAIRSEGRQRIENRARKLVLDFGRDLHAAALLNLRFGTLLWRGSHDLGMGIDFTVFPHPKTPVGVQAHMKAFWKAEDWLKVHEQRRARRGATEPPFPLVWMTNKTHQPLRLGNGVWLFTSKHVDEVVAQIEALGIGSQRPLFDH